MKSMDHNFCDNSPIKKDQKKFLSSEDKMSFNFSIDSEEISEAEEESD